MTPMERMARAECARANRVWRAGDSEARVKRTGVVRPRNWAERALRPYFKSDLTADEIAELVGCHRSTVLKIFKKMRDA